MVDSGVLVSDFSYIVVSIFLEKVSSVVLGILVGIFLGIVVVGLLITGVSSIFVILVLLGIVSIVVSSIWLFTLVEKLILFVSPVSFSIIGVVWRLDKFDVFWIVLEEVNCSVVNVVLGFFVDEVLEGYVQGVVVGLVLVMAIFVVLVKSVWIDLGKVIWVVFVVEVISFSIVV